MKETMKWLSELAQLEFGLIRMEQIPDVACRALAAGFDSKWLRILAGLNKSDSVEIAECLKRTLDELGIQNPSRKESARELILAYIDQIIDGRINVELGLHHIVRDVFGKMYEETAGEHLAGESLGIHDLVSSYWQIDDLREIVVDWNSPCEWDESKSNDEMLDELRKEAIESAKKCKQTVLTATFFSALNNP
jgi:hypothetical protein